MWLHWQVYKCASCSQSQTTQQLARFEVFLFFFLALVSFFKMDCFSKRPEKHNEVMMLPSAVGAAPLWAPTWTSVSTDSPGSAVGGSSRKHTVAVRVQRTKGRRICLKSNVTLLMSRSAFERSAECRAETDGDKDWTQSHLSSQQGASLKWSFLQRGWKKNQQCMAKVTKLICWLTIHDYENLNGTMKDVARCKEHIIHIYRFIVTKNIYI